MGVSYSVLSHVKEKEMKKFLFLLMWAIPAFAAVTNSGVYEIDRMNPIARKYGLGSSIGLIIKGQYDFAISGGGIGHHRLLTTSGDSIVLPAKAIVKRCIIDVVTVPAGATNATRLVVSLDQANNGDLKASTQVGSGFNGKLTCIPDGTLPTMIKLASAQTLDVLIASEALTSGKFNVFVEYFLSN